MAEDSGESLPVDMVLDQVVEQEAKWNPAVSEREYLGFFDRTVSFLNRYRLLPEAYLQGLAIYRLEGRVRPSCLNGEYSLRGFRTYFLWTFLLKTPLVTLLVIAGELLVATPNACARCAGPPWNEPSSSTVSATRSSSIAWSRGGPCALPSVDTTDLGEL